LDSRILMWPGKQIYVVDDDSGFLKGIERLLRAHGFEVRTFSSAEEFEAAADPAKASCLIVDIHLDGSSGLELLCRLNRAGSKTPVVLVTGQASEVTQRAAAAAGCSAFLEKPFSGQVLMDALVEAVGPDFEI
jgi:FixJ family two-component response regulator